MEDNINPYRYVIVACSAAVLFFSPATGYSNGVFLVNLKRTGLYDVDTLAWVMALTQFMHAMGGPVAGFLIPRSSCRTVVILSGVIGLVGFSLGSVVSDVRVLFISYGLILGLARGMAFASTNVNIGYWFKESSSVATGLTFAGVGLGMLVHPRLVQALVDWFDVQDAMLLMGAFIFHTCILGMLLRASEFEKRRKSILKEEKLSRKGDSLIVRISALLQHFSSSVLKNSTFMWFVFGICMFDMAFQSIMIFLPDFYNTHGTTPQEAALAVSLMGVGSLISRILAGIMTNDPNIGTMLLFAGNSGICSIITFFLYALAKSQIGRYVYSICIGTYLSCIFVLIGPTTLQKVGIDDLPYGFGFIIFICGISNLFGPPLAMQVRHITDSYFAVFVMAGCLLAGACSCGCLSEIFKKKGNAESLKPVEPLLRSSTIVIDENCVMNTPATVRERIDQSPEL